MIKVWYVHAYAGSPSHGMSYRPYYLSKNFREHDVDTTIISSSYHHLSSITGIGQQVIDDQDFYFVPVNRYSGNGFKRISNMLAFGIKLFGSGFRSFAYSNKPDVIIASTAHPFHIFAAKFYAKLFKAKLILEVRDIWPMSLNELAGLSKLHPFSILVNICQKFGYKYCDECVSLLENSEKFFLSQGLEAGKFTYIPNGIELSEHSSINNELVEKLKESLSGFSKVIGYTGALGLPNNLMPLIESATYLKDFNIAILLVGDGVEKTNLMKKVDELGINNVVFFGKVPKKDIHTIIDYCDAMFINALPKNIYKYGISPNKIFDYMLENKVVFNGIESKGNPLEKSRSEIRFPSNDAYTLAEKIIEFSTESFPSEIKSELFVRNNYSYKVLARRYVSLIHRLVYEKNSSDRC
ncbi:glycosyltransferase family 4 protein [Vibrio splendidus]